MGVIGELVVGLLVAQHLLNVSPHLVQVFLLLLSASSSSLLLTASSIMSSEHLVAGQNLVLNFKYPLTVFPVLLLMFSDGKRFPLENLKLSFPSSPAFTFPVLSVPTTSITSNLSQILCARSG